MNLTTYTHHVPMLWLFALILPTASLVEAEPLILRNAVTHPTPSVNRSRIIYQIDLVFDHRPQDYWGYLSHRNENEAHAVLDCYGYTVVDSMRRFKPTEIFHSLEVENELTPLSLSGEQARILVGVDPGWRMETVAVDSTTIGILVWKEMGSPGKKQKKSPWRWPIFGIILGILAAGGIMIPLAAD